MCFLGDIFFFSFVNNYLLLFYHPKHVSAPAEASSCGISLLCGTMQQWWVAVLGTALLLGALSKHSSCQKPWAPTPMLLQAACAACDASAEQLLSTPGQSWSRRSDPSHSHQNTDLCLCPANYFLAKATRSLELSTKYTFSFLFHQRNDLRVGFAEEKTVEIVCSVASACCGR